MKKKICALLSATCMTLTTAVVFAACGEEKKPPVDTGMTATEWAEATSESNFLNFTLNQSGHVITYANTAIVENVHQSFVLKFDADGFSISGKTVPDGSNTSTSVKKVVFGDKAEDFKRTYTEAMFIFLSDYDNFTYDAEKKVYTVSEAVSSTEVVDGELCTLLLESGTVTFSATGKVKAFICNYTQTLEDGTKIVSEMTWTFSAYEMTEIEEPDEEGDSSIDTPEEAEDGIASGSY